MSIFEAIHIYKKAGNCTFCFDNGIGQLPTGGCRLPQPRWIGPQYWESPARIIVCMVNPGTGNEIEKEFEDTLKGFYSGRNPFLRLNNYFKKVMPRWGGGSYLRCITHHMQLKLDQIALMNIALCPMSAAGVKNFYPHEALAHCFVQHTRLIMAALEPDIVVLCGSSVHSFKKHIEDQTHAFVIKAPHYASRTSLKVMRETYAIIRESIAGVTQLKMETKHQNKVC